MNQANNSYFAPSGLESPPVPSSFSPQQWQEIKDIIQYEISMAFSRNLPVAEPLAESPSSASTVSISCRRCHLEFPSKSQLLQHIQTRPKCVRIKTIVDLAILPREYPLHPGSPMHTPAAVSSGYGGGYGYSFVSGPPLDEDEGSDSGDEYQQELELQLDLDGDYMDSPAPEPDAYLDEELSEGGSYTEGIEHVEGLEFALDNEHQEHPEPAEAMDFAGWDVSNDQGYECEYEESYDEGYDNYDNYDDGSWSE